MQINNVCIHVDAHFGVFHREPVLALKIDKQHTKRATTLTGHVSDKVQHDRAILARAEGQIHALKIVERAMDASLRRLKNRNAN
jgi:hypothetical protein